MNYARFVDDLSGEIQGLSIQQQRDLFFILGYGLTDGVDVSSDWRRWLNDAKIRALRAAESGPIQPGDHEAWVEMQRLSIGEDISQQAMSAVTCLSSVFGPFDQTHKIPGEWVEQAILPILNAESEVAYGDVSLPGDDVELDQVFLRRRVQEAATFIVETCHRVQAEGRIDLLGVAERARVLSPRGG